MLSAGVSVAMTTHHDQKQLGEKGFVSPYSSEVCHGRNPGQELEEKPGKAAAYYLLLPVCSTYTTQAPPTSRKTAHLCEARAKARLSVRSPLQPELGDSVSVSRMSQSLEL